jgi:hypothetical protein
LTAIIDITISIRNTLINVVEVFGYPRVGYHWVFGGLCDFFHAIKNPHHCVVRVILLVEAAGIIRPLSSPLRGRRRFASALSRAFALG